MKKKVCILTLGCPKNIADSEKIFNEINKNNNFIWTETAETSDIILLNTCGFIQDAIDETIKYIKALTNLKQQNFDIKIIVYGCAVTRLLNENFQLQTTFPAIDHFLPIAQKAQIAELLQACTTEANLHHPANGITEPASDNLPYVYLKISDGCNRKCSFCTIPSIKGKYVSIPKAEIIDTAKHYIANGKKEIILIGQETTNYGIDINSNLYELVDELSALKGLQWLRIMYAHPQTFDLRLLELMKQRPNICKYIDMPLQHIDDTILIKMGRGGNSDNIKQLIATIRNTMPEIRIRSTFITGFPGETKRQHNELLAFLKEVKLDRVGVFKYSKEAGTLASAMEKQIEKKEKQARFDRLMLAQQQVSLELNRKLIGQKVNVLIEQNDNIEHYLGRTEFDAPDIDCDVKISKNGAKILQIGDIITCRVTGAEHYTLEAEAM